MLLSIFYVLKVRLSPETGSLPAAQVEPLRAAALPKARRPVLKAPQTHLHEILHRVEGLDHPLQLGRHFGVGCAPNGLAGSCARGPKCVKAGNRGARAPARAEVGPQHGAARLFRACTRDVSSWLDHNSSGQTTQKTSLKPWTCLLAALPPPIARSSSRPSSYRSRSPSEHPKIVVSNRSKRTSSFLCRLLLWRRRPIAGPCLVKPVPVPLIPVRHAAQERYGLYIAPIGGSKWATEWEHSNSPR